jgi:hypothetical protein
MAGIHRSENISCIGGARDESVEQGGMPGINAQGCKEVSRSRAGIREIAAVAWISAVPCICALIGQVETYSEM